MSGANITLKDILERKLKHAESQKAKAEPIDFSVTDPLQIRYEEFVAVLDGEINAVNDMINDIDKMNEADFMEKYSGIGKTLNKEFDEQLEEKYNRIAEAKQNGSDVYAALEGFPEQTEKSGYYNVIMEIVKLYDPASLSE